MKMAEPSNLSPISTLPARVDLVTQSHAYLPCLWRYGDIRVMSLAGVIIAVRAVEYSTPQ